MLEFSIAYFATFLNGVIAGFAVLGGFMAAVSGLEAANAFWRGRPQRDLANAVNEGLALGFTCGAPFALGALMIAGNL